MEYLSHSTALQNQNQNSYPVLLIAMFAKLQFYLVLKIANISSVMKSHAAWLPRLPDWLNHSKQQHWQMQQHWKWLCAYEELGKLTERAYRISVLLFAILSCDSSTSYFIWSELPILQEPILCAARLTDYTVQGDLCLYLPRSVLSLRRRTVTRNRRSGGELSMTGP